MANVILNDYFTDNEGNQKLVLSHSIKRASETTEKPVESGARITDHVILQPMTISLEFELFDEFEQIGELSHTYGVLTGSTIKRSLIKSASDKLDDIAKLQYNKIMVDFVNLRDGKVYENYQIVSLDTKETKDMINGVSGSLELKQINVSMALTTYDLGTYNTSLTQGAGTSTKGDGTSIGSKVLDKSILIKIKDWIVDMLKEVPKELSKDTK